MRCVARLKADLAIVCPAFPTNKRTIYIGNLFVGDVPLAESPMKDHPLTPMRDSNLVRVLQRQTKHKVGLVPFATVSKGADAIDDAFRAARARGERYVVCDAITDEHLYTLGQAAADMPLITGGSGIALGLPSNFIKRGLMKAAPPPQTMAADRPRAFIIAGSCSEATRGQVNAAINAGVPAYRVEPRAGCGPAASSQPPCRRLGARPTADEAGAGLFERGARRRARRAGQIRSRRRGRHDRDDARRLRDALVADRLYAA